MDLTKYKRIFIEESEKYLKELDDLLLRVEKELNNTDLWTEIHGKIHSMKGMARALSLESITNLSHLMEEWCKKFQSGDTSPTADALQMIFDGADQLRLMVEKVDDAGTEEDNASYESLVSQFEKGPENLEKQDRPQAQRAPTPDLPAGRIDHVRVNYRLIDELLGLSQEIMLLEKSLPPVSLEQASRGLKKWIDTYIAMLKGLHFRLAQLRLISVSDFADIFVKTIRNLAREYGKEVEFEVVGGKLQADITLLERLREPFIHILRNAIGHGIESPEERVEKGKETSGKIILEARREKDSLFIKIWDDGRGIDRAAITTYLKEKKSLTDEEISTMPDEEFFDVILRPEFTSAKETTDLSGRGVGMNQVVQVIEYLGGSLSIRSEPNKGTEFLIRLPVSLSIIHSIVFNSGRYTLSIPTSVVNSVDRLDDLSDDETVAAYDLKDLLGIEDGKKAVHVLKLKPPSKYAQEDEDQEFSILVDDIVGNKPLMVMPVGELLAKAKLFAGVGIMENGDISILLDIDSLSKRPKPLEGVRDMAH